jgi:hypothetical protein
MWFDDEGEDDDSDGGVDNNGWYCRRRPILLRSGLLLAREAWSDGRWAKKESKHKICARDTFPIRRRNALLLPLGRTFFLLVGREEREREAFPPRATLRYSG